MLLLCALCAAVAATPTQLSQDMQLLHPQIITIERLEHLLRRAGEIFGAVAQEEDALAAGSEPVAQVVLPSQQPQNYMLPPTAQPYNFYLPLFDYVDPKLDAKSKRMEKIVPPPQRLQQEHNYYGDKPKKTPKKFNAGSKHINLKWLNTYEKAMGGNAAPKSIYMEQDERNRINFDDSFFSVDMHVKAPDNQPHNVAPVELLQHGEQLPEDDLMAAPAQLTYSFKPTGL